jgi:WD40 repeat protein
MDTFQIFVWAMKTARLLDVMAAHEGPVVDMAFSPVQPLLATASWDKTVRTWDVFRCSLHPCLGSSCFAAGWHPASQSVGFHPSEPFLG